MPNNSLLPKYLLRLNIMKTNTLKIALRTCCAIAYLSPLVAFADCADPEAACTEAGGFFSKDGTCSKPIPSCPTPTDTTNSGSTNNQGGSTTGKTETIPIPCSEGSLSNCVLPILSVFSLNSKSGAPSTAATSFKGGIAVSTNGQLAPYAIDNQSLNQGDTIVVSGTITPLAAHLGKTADILVVGLYKAKVDSTVDNCDPAGGEYYMNTADSTFTDNYCNWINGGISTTCNTQDRTTRSARQPSEYWQRWNGHLTTELKPYQQAILTDPLDLPILYKDKLNHAGHVCINFGYRLTDGTIVFNGEPIKYQVK